MSQESQIALALVVLLVLATGWSTKMFVEGAELMDLAGLSVVMLALGYAMGAWK